MLPNATFIGFTGTPIGLTDKNNRPNKHGYPTGKQEKTTQTVLEQAAGAVRGMGCSLALELVGPSSLQTPFDSMSCHVHLK